ncbi:MAG: hypothetical protein ACREYF_17295, partial [Gammaproteobacteria bacterium]
TRPIAFNSPHLMTDSLQRKVGEWAGSFAKEARPQISVLAYARLAVLCGRVKSGGGQGLERRLVAQRERNGGSVVWSIS